MNLYGQWFINYVKQWGRNDRYTLEGMIKKDEGYFTIEASQRAHKTQKVERRKR